MRLHILSSYDEFIRFYTLPPDYSLAVAEKDKILIINSPRLAKFLKSELYSEFLNIPILEITPYKKAPKFSPWRYISLKWHLKKLIHDVILKLDTKKIDIVLYTTFMNGVTGLFLQRLVNQPQCDTVTVTLIPSLPHIIPRKTFSSTLLEYIKERRDAYLYDAITGRVDIGHLVIPAIRGTVFDSVEFLPVENRPGMFPMTKFMDDNVLDGDQHIVLFLTQPMKKNSRATESSIVAFFFELKRSLNILNCKLVLKLHPGESPEDYFWIGADMIADYVPFQLLDTSLATALLTFSSGAVAGRDKPVISCSRLLAYRDNKDRESIEKLFDRRLANDSLPPCHRPHDWEAFRNEISQLIHS